MSVDVVDTIRSTFGRFKTEPGWKLVLAFLVLQLVNLGLTQYGLTAGGAASLVSGLALVLVGVAGIALFIGAFRSLTSGELMKSDYTTNLLWPFLRLTGANIVTTVFVVIGAYIALLPVLLLGGGAALLGSSLGMAGASASPALMALGVLLMLVFALYPLFALITAVPMVAVNDNRMFQALDRAVQRSKGQKLAMFLASLPVALLYVVNVATALTSSVGMSTGAGASPVAMLVSSVVSAVTGVAFVSLLVEYNNRLPE